MKKNLFKLLVAGLLLTFIPISVQADDKVTDALVVVSKQSPADILPAVTLSNYINSEVLIFDKNKIPTMKFDKNKNIIVVGGESSLNNDIFKNIHYTRISGKDRYETSIAVLNYANKFKKVEKVNLVSGKSYVDSSIVASSKDIAMSISNNTIINEKIKSNLDNLNITKVNIIGGELKINDNTKNLFGAVRISGKDRYETSKIFASNNKNGYIQSESGSFYKNILDAKKSMTDNKGFLFINSLGTRIYLYKENTDPKYEIGDLLIKNDKKIINMLEKIDMLISENNSDRIIPHFPSNTAYSIKIKTPLQTVFVEDEISNKNEMHIAISKNNSYAKEYIVKDVQLINHLIDIINTSIYDEYSI